MKIYKLNKITNKKIKINFIILINFRIKKKLIYIIGMKII
jgi:hypothetical protein